MKNTDRTQQSLETKRARLDRSRTRPSRNTALATRQSTHPTAVPSGPAVTLTCVSPWTSELKRATVGDKRVVRCDDDTF